MTTIHICRKKSGNYFFTSDATPVHEVIATVNNPADLITEVRKLSNYYNVILSEYSQSQRKTKPAFFSETDALFVFGIPKTKESYKLHFSK